MTVSIIIDAPGLRSRGLRYRDWALTILMWGLWIFVCRHLVMFFGWLGGVYTGILDINAMIELRHVGGPLVLYAAIAAGNGALLILWARYNQIRFRGRDRRQTHRRVTVDDLAAFFDVATGEIRRCAGARRMVMHHHADGRIEAIGMGAAAPEPVGA